MTLTGDRIGDTAALTQGIALSDTEAMLLVDDDQSEEGDLHRLRQQGVGSHDDGRLARGQVGQDPAALGRRGGAGQQMDPGGALGATEHPQAAQGAENRLEGGVVLGGEHLGGSQQGRLTSTSDHLEHGTQGYKGLAATHVALEEALHGDGASQVGGDLLPDSYLPGSQVIGQCGIEVGSQGSGRLRLGPGNRRPGRLVVRSPLSQGHLQDKGLLVAQPGTGGLPLVGVIGSVDPPVGGVGVDESGLAPQVLGQGVGDVSRFQLVQDGPHRLAHRPGREGLRARVDGHGTGQEGLALGLVELVKDVQARVGQLPASTVEPHLAAHENSGSRSQLGGAGAHLARRAELDDVHGRDAVGDGGLHEGRRPARTRAAGGCPHDLGLDSGLLTLDERAHVGEVPPGVVAPGQKAQQVTPGLHPLLGELGGGALTHEPGHGTPEEPDAAGTRRAGRAIRRAGHGTHPMPTTVLWR